MDREQSKAPHYDTWVHLDAIEVQHSYADIAGARVLLRNAMKDGSGSPGAKKIVKHLVDLLDALEREKE
jgi:hypothetical protein